MKTMKNKNERTTATSPAPLAARTCRIVILFAFLSRLCYYFGVRPEGGKPNKVRKNRHHAPRARRRRWWQLRPQPRPARRRPWRPRARECLRRGGNNCESIKNKVKKGEKRFLKKVKKVHVQDASPAEEQKNATTKKL